MKVLPDNYSTEVLESVCFEYKSDKDTMVEMLRYLYHNTTDDVLRYKVINILNEFNICVDCGDKMEYYEWTESRPVGEETMSCYDCLRCQKER